MVAVYNGELRQRIAAMPKIELHRHLEGSIRLETLIDIGQQYNLELPGNNIDALRPYVQMTPLDARNADRFLSKFGVLRHFYQSPEIIRRITAEAIEDAARDNVRYLELRFTPSTLGKLRSYPVADVIDWVTDAAAQAAYQHGLMVRLIVSMNRHEPVELGQQALEAALRYRNRGIVGLDLAGHEMGFPARPFCPMFVEARQNGLGITIHAGEWAGAENVRDAIENMGALRIGHGVNVVQDSQVVRLARERGVVFEVCPTSNYQSGVVADIHQHPLIDLHSLKLLVTINTDDPAISNIRLTDELLLAAEMFGLSLHMLQVITMNAVEAAFLTEVEKNRLRDQIQQTFARNDSRAGG